MLQTLITSKTRIKLLMKFFLNSRTTSYLRDLANEFGESTNAIRVELNRMEEAGLLNSHKQGNKKVYQSNAKHPLFGTIQQLLRKHTGIDQIVEHLVHKIGGLHSAYVVGDFARGHDSQAVELLLLGTDIDTNYLENLAGKAEEMINRKIRYMHIQPDESADILRKYPEALLLWGEETQGAAPDRTKAQ